MAAGVADRLLGRDQELARLRAAAGAGRSAVVYLHGAGGTGKTTLLRCFAAEMRDSGRTVVSSLAQVRAAKAPVVLCLDDVDQCPDQLRDRFLPRLPRGSLAVLTSRRAPDLMWQVDTGWATVFQPVPLGDLPTEAARQLLDQHRVAPELHEAILAFAGGNPLALSLAAAPATWPLADDVRATLIDRLVGEVPSALHRRAVEVSAHAPVTTEETLRSVLGGPAAELFQWLRHQPFVETTPDGVRPHDAVRAALQADLRRRDPDGCRTLHERIAGPPGPTPRFSAAVRALLRGWHSAEPGLRAPVAEAVDELRRNPRDRKAHQVLVTTYFERAASQEAAAARLGIPLSTYRRHLARGIERVSVALWHRGTWWGRDDK